MIQIPAGMWCGLIFAAFLTPGRGCLLRTEARAKNSWEVDSLFQCWIFGIHQIGQKKKILCFGDGMTFSTFSDFLLLHPEQISHQWIFFGLKYFKWKITNSTDDLHDIRDQLRDIIIYRMGQIFWLISQIVNSMSKSYKIPRKINTKKHNLF